MKAADRMRHIGLALTLLLHLALFLAFQQWSRHTAMPAVPRGEVAMLWMAPLKPVPLQSAPARSPDRAAIRPWSRPPAASRAAPEKNTAITIVAPAAPPADPAPAAADAGRVLADPAALVRTMHLDDDKSDLRRAIEAHGGNLASAKKEKYAAFQDAVEAATVPDCVGSTDDGKTKAGSNSAGGLFALPVLIAAKLTGHCK